MIVNDPNKFTLGFIKENQNELKDSFLKWKTKNDISSFNVYHGINLAEHFKNEFFSLNISELSHKLNKSILKMIVLAYQEISWFDIAINYLYNLNEVQNWVSAGYSYCRGNEVLNYINN